MGDFTLASSVSAHSPTGSSAVCSAARPAGYLVARSVVARPCTEASPRAPRTSSPSPFHRTLPFFFRPPRTTHRAARPRSAAFHLASSLCSLQARRRVVRCSRGACLLSVVAVVVMPPRVSFVICSVPRRSGPLYPSPVKNRANTAQSRRLVRLPARLPAGARLWKATVRRRRGRCTRRVESVTRLDGGMHAGAADQTGTRELPNWRGGSLGAGRNGGRGVNACAGRGA